MDTNRSCELSDTSNRKLNLLACSHDEVAILVNNDNDIRHKPMSILRIKLAFAELFVVFLDVPCMGFLEQVIALVHLDTEAL